MPRPEPSHTETLPQAPNRRKAISLLVTAAVLWSLGGLLIKMVSWNPMAIAGMRSAIAAVVLLLLVRRPGFTFSLTQLGGAVAYAGTVFLFVVATKLTTAANAILLQYTAPIYVAIFGAWFLRERASWLDWIAISIVLGGMTLFFLDSLTTAGFWGNVCAALSGMSFGWLVLLLRKQRAGSPVGSVILGNIIAAVAGLPFMFGSGPGVLGWAGLMLLGVFQLGLSYYLYSLAIKHVPALEAMLIQVIEPILNPTLVSLTVGEFPGPLALAGGVIVVGAISAQGLLRVRLSKALAPEGR